MAAKLPEILIFLTRGEMLFFEPQNGFAKSLSIPETVVKDLEVIDPGGLSTLIASFLDREKVSPSLALIVLAEAISFSKDIQAGEESRNGVLVQDFTDSVPLESPEVKVFQAQGASRLIAVNLKHYQVLMEILTAKGFSVAGVIPGSIIPEVGAAATISLGVAGRILESFDKYRFQNFINAAEINSQVQPPAVITTAAPKGSRIYILVGVFLLGAVILLALLFLRK